MIQIPKSSKIIQNHPKSSKSLKHVDDVTFFITESCCSHNIQHLEKHVSQRSAGLTKPTALTSSSLLLRSARKSKRSGPSNSSMTCPALIGLVFP